ncbi:MAG: prephenate dehydrogenase/arogenate dehydrogenase family protein [Oscillochloris sp.]|nr:prephenate dehydrogenase/arogenate dehydrogenase family protein [Oscillochloris sp.]
MIRISIVGLGLIGTSLGMALRSADPKESPLGAIEVVGFDRDQRALKEARGRLAIDREARTLADALRETNLVVLATPVLAAREVMSQIAVLLPPGTVVTDVASTKAEIATWAGELLPLGISYVGGHPMAGREQSGAGAAVPDLFQDAIYCLTTIRNTRQEAVDLVEAMVRTIGAKPYYIDPQEHDAYVAGISHLPLLLSAALIEVTSSSPAWKEMAPLAATGFRDVSRLASGDPEMHRDILLSNKAGMSRWINDMLRLLLDVRDQIEAGDSAAIEELLRRAREQREAWLDTKPNMRPGEAAFIQTPEIERSNMFTFRLPNRRK